MHSARYQQSLRRYQARMIRRRDFSEGDLVIRLRQDNRGLLTVKIRQPSHEFTFGVGMSFIPYPLVLTPVV
jgi:hypothetical protein